MNSKEIVLGILNNSSVERSPYCLSIGPLLNKKLTNAYGEDYKEKIIKDDVCQVSMWVRWPLVEYVEKNGVTWIKSILLNSLSEVEDYPFPNADTPIWYSAIEETIKEKGKDHPIFVLFPAIFHTMDLFRGYDKFFLDVYDNPKKTGKLLEKCSKVLETVVRNLCQMDIDVLMIGDDISTQDALLASSKFLDEYVFKYDFRYLEIAKKYNKKAIFHTDGVIPDDIMERLISMGFDGIHPMQPTCNDMRSFAKKYKDKIVVYGGLDNTKTIPEGNIEDIREHILELFSLFNDRIIFSSSSIMDNTPFENVLKLPEIIKDNCVF